MVRLDIKALSFCRLFLYLLRSLRYGTWSAFLFHEDLKRKQIVCIWATHDACWIWYSNLLFPLLNLILGYNEFSTMIMVWLKSLLILHLLFKKHYALCLFNASCLEFYFDMTTSYMAFFLVNICLGHLSQTFKVNRCYFVLSEYFIIDI